MSFCPLEKPLILLCICAIRFVFIPIALSFHGLTAPGYGIYSSAILKPNGSKCKKKSVFLQKTRRKFLFRLKINGIYGKDADAECEYRP